MVLKSILTAGLAAALGAISGCAQSAAELLQKGIYTQETLGDVDGAIQIYRQILKSESLQQNAATQVHYRLALLLIRKGDRRGADLEAREIMKYPGNNDLIDNLRSLLFATQTYNPAQTMTAAEMAAQCPTPTLGTVQNDRYHHKKTGVEFDVPTDWKVVCTTPSSGNGEITWALQNSKPKDASISVWMIQENIAPADIPVRLRWDLAEKEGSRRAQFSERYGYRMDTVQETTVNGQLALMALADYPDPVTKEPMSEWHTWIYTTKTRAYIFGRVRTSELETFRPVYEKLVFSAKVP